jgi:hypothetical protein
MNLPSRRSLTALVALGLAACDSANEPADPIDELRRATQAFQQVGAAEAAGYAQAGPCVATPAGGMGFHYVNQGLVDGLVDPVRPQARRGAPPAGGELALVGVEFVVDAEAWDASHEAAPRFAGQPFDDHRAPEARHGLPFAHYDLHVWVWRANSNGMFAPFNPAAGCS